MIENIQLSALKGWILIICSTISDQVSLFFTCFSNVQPDTVDQALFSLLYMWQECSQCPLSPEFASRSCSELSFSIRGWIPLIRSGFTREAHSSLLTWIVLGIKDKQDLAHISLSYHSSSFPRIAHNSLLNVTY